MIVTSGQNTQGKGIEIVSRRVRPVRITISVHGAIHHVPSHSANFACNLTKTSCNLTMYLVTLRDECERVKMYLPPFYVSMQDNQFYTY